MGQVYKGLTIQIGADTHKLQNAFKQIQTAVSTTQSQLKTINSALQFDDRNVLLVKDKIKLLNENAVASANKLAEMQNALHQLSDKKIIGIINTTENLNVESAKLSEEWSRQVSLQAQLANQLKDNAAYHKLAFDKSDPQSFVDELKKIASVSRDEVKDNQKLVDLYLEQKDALIQLDEANKTTITARNYRDLKITVSQLTEQTKQAYVEMNKFTQLSSRPELNKLDDSIKAIDDELAELKEEAKRTEEQLQLTNKALKFDPTNLSNVADKVELLKKQSSNAEKQAELLKNKLDLIKKSGIEDASQDMSTLAKKTREAKEAWEKSVDELSSMQAELETTKRLIELINKDTEDNPDNVKKNTEAVKELQTQTNKLTYNIGVAQKESEKLNDEFKKAERTQTYAEVAQEVKNLEKEIDSANGKVTGFNRSTWDSIRDLSTTLAATLTPAVFGAINSITEAANTIDSAFRDMKKTVNGTEEDFENLRQKAIEFSQTHAVSADTILEIESMGGQLGIAVDNLEEFALVASNLDIATDLDADEVSEQLGQLNNILQWGTGDMERYGDALVRLGNNMPAQESKISSITLAIGAAGNIFGMTTPEILAWSTAIAATGQGAEAAGTAISNTMYDIEAAVGAGGEELEAFAQVANMSAEDFAATWQTKPSDAMRAFIYGLKGLEEQGDSATNTLDELEIRGVRQIRSLLSLTQTVDTLDDSLEMSNDAWNGISDKWGQAGDAAREAAQKSEGFSGQLKMLQNATEALQASFGDGLIPLMKAGTDVIVMLNKVVGVLPPELISTGAALSAIVASGAVLGRIVAQGLTTINSLKSGLAELLVKLALSDKAVINSTTSTKKLVNENGKLTLSLKDAKGNIVQYNTALNATKIAAAAAASVIAAVVIPALINAYQEHEKLIKSTSGLSDAMRVSATKSSSSYGELTTNVVSDTAKMRDEIKKVIEKNAELAESIKTSITEANTNAALLDNVKGVFQDLSTAVELTDSDISKLETATKLLNETTGETYTVGKDAAGIYLEEADGTRIYGEKIYELIDAKKSLLMYEAYEEAYGEVLKQKLEVEQKLVQAKIDYANAVKQANGNEADWNVQQTVKNMNDLLTQYDSLSASMDIASAYMDSYRYAMDMQSEAAQALSENTLLLQTLVSNDIPWQEFSTAMDNAGVSLDGLKDISATDAMAIAEAYKNGTDEAIAAIKIFSDDTLNYADVTGQGWKRYVESGMESSVEIIAKNLGISESNLVWFADQCGYQGKEGMSKFIKAVESNQGDIENRLKEVAQGYNDKFKDPLFSSRDGSWASGQYFVQGFVNGVKDLASWASSQIESFGASMATSLNYGIDARSPSRKTRKSGRFFDRGLILGIEDEADDAKSAAKNLGNSITDALNMSLSGSSFNVNDSILGLSSLIGGMSGLASWQSGIANRLIAGAGSVTTAGNSTVDNSSVDNSKIVYNITVDAKDLEDVKTVNEIVNIFGRARNQYSR